MMRLNNRSILTKGCLAMAMIVCALAGIVHASDRLTIALAPAEIESNRFWQSTWGNFQQYEPMLETLIGNDPVTGRPIPRLAERWEHSDDFSVWTFYLRRGVSFHFGYGEFSAEDVKHSWELITREDALLHAWWRIEVREVEIVDDYTVVFHFHNPVYEGERRFSRTGTNLYIVSKAQWDATGEEGMERELAGTGAYRFKERVAGRNLLMERVDDHWRDRPAFAELEFRWVPDAVTRTAMLLAGEVDMAHVGRDQADDAVAQGMRILTSQQDNMQVVATFEWVYLDSETVVGKPTEDNVMLNPLVREALNRAIDREVIRDFLYSGRAEPLALWGWHPSNLGWDPSWEERFDELYGYDPDRARELLAEAGFGPGELEFTVFSYLLAGQPEIPDLVEALHLLWTQIGATVHIEDIDFAGHQARTRAGQNQPGIRVIRNAPIRSIDEFIELWLGPRGPVGTVAYMDDTTLDLYYQFRGATTTEERDRLAREFGEYIFERYATMPIASTRVEVLVNPGTVEAWTWPGESPATFTHWYEVVPAR